MRVTEARAIEAFPNHMPTPYSRMVHTCADGSARVLHTPSCMTLTPFQDSLCDHASPARALARRHHRQRASQELMALQSAVPGGPRLGHRIEFLPPAATSAT